MNRRKFMAAIAAGAIITASGLWIPGQKLISIPKKQTFFGFPRSYFSEGTLEELVIEMAESGVPVRIATNTIWAHASAIPRARAKGLKYVQDGSGQVISIIINNTGERAYLMGV